MIKLSKVQKQRQVREELEARQYESYIEFRDSYKANLLDLLFELDQFPAVVNVEFRKNVSESSDKVIFASFFDNDAYYGDEVLAFPMEFSQEDFYKAKFSYEEAISRLERMNEKAVAEAKKKALREQALSKLSAEELEALDLV